MSVNYIFKHKKNIIDIYIECKFWQEINNIKKISNFIIKKTMKHLIKNNCLFNISLLLTNDKKLKYLNNIFKNNNKTTNVLAFSYYKQKTIQNLIKKNYYLFLGDIAISYNKMICDSIKNNKCFNNYFISLLIHGVLHLYGYDHKFQNETKIMQKLEDEIMNYF